MTATATPPGALDEVATPQDSTIVENGGEGAEPIAARRPYPTLAFVVGTALAVWGLIIGINALHDNSFLTHLATGRLILDRGGIPRSDPYSFTALGRPWVVQSWLASVVYAGAEKVGGLGAIRVLVGLSTMGLAALVWRLTRPAQGLIGRLGIAVLAIGIGCSMWVERPLLFGLLGMAAVLLAADGAFDPRWLVPVMWIWVNTHGSFPLALVVVGLLALGRKLDGRSPSVELRVLLWVGIGILVAGINPLGPRLLLFPLELVRHTDSFKAIAEWQPPKFDNLGQQLFAVQLVVAAALLIRRPSWRYALVLVAFAGLALTSARNIAPASLVLVPVMAEAARGLGTVDGSQRSRVAQFGVVALLLLGIVVGVSQLQQPDTNLTAYPTGALSWLSAHHLVGPASTGRLVTRDYVGNLLEARYGTAAHVYIDDRVDMYPPELVKDYVRLLRTQPGWQRALARAHPTAVLWDRSSKLGQQLIASPDWRVAYRDAGWIIVVPRATAPGRG